MTLTLEDLDKARQLTHPVRHWVNAIVCPPSMEEEIRKSTKGKSETFGLGMRVYVLPEMERFKKFLTFQKVIDAYEFTREVEKLREAGEDRYKFIEENFKNAQKGIFDDRKS